MASAIERRVKRVYNYRGGLIVMTYEEGKDATVFDPPRLALWNFEKADDAFEFARTGRLPTPPASISRGVGLSAAATDSKIGQQVVQQDDFVPIASTALILD
jgi:hypothetical protein